MWWLVSRKSLEFAVTPKGAADERVRGRAPRVLWVLTAVVTVVLVYAGAGMLGWVPWRTGDGSTVASGVWLALAGFVLYFGARRIRSADFSTSRRNAYRVALDVPISIDGVDGMLADISVGGAAVRFPFGTLPSSGLVEFHLPGAAPIKMEMVRVRGRDGEHDLASLRTMGNDWSAYRTMSLWLFHTPTGAVRGLETGVPVIACVSPV
jgi:cellulose synthase (UDP-forming)